MTTIQPGEIEAGIDPASQSGSPEENNDEETHEIVVTKELAPSTSTIGTALVID